MKKIYTFILVFALILLTSCRGSSPTEKMLKAPFEHTIIDRVIITSTRNAAKYTIVDTKSISRFKSHIQKGRDATENSKLEADFIFEFYDGKKEIASFNYIAGLDDKKIANLIDEKGRLYHIGTSVENEFIKRVMRKANNKNVPEYYISLIELMLDKSKIPENSTVVVDITKDYTVTKSILSIEQKRILDSVDTRGVKIKLPGEVDKYDYYIKISTSSYTDMKSNALVGVKDKLNIEKWYYVDGKFEKDEWSHHIRFK